jgi:hypothetical protein
MCLFNFADNACSEQNESFSTLKTLIFRKYNFQKLTQLSKGNKVLDAAPSNIHGCLSREAWDSLTKLNRRFWNKMSLTPT